MLAVPIIAVLSLVLNLICLVVLFLMVSRQKVRAAVADSQVQANELVITNLQYAHEKLSAAHQSLAIKHEQTSVESTQVSKQLEHRIKLLQNNIHEHQVAMEQLQTEQGVDKFYSRAIKLAKKGADLDEIVNECELPRAEVEMLLSVYQSTTSS